MKAPDHFELDLSAGAAELEDFRGLLATDTALGERAQILGFFRDHRHLAAMIGFHNAKINDPDRLGFEFALFGNYVSDLIVGDSRSRRYCFVEFEDAGPRSVFVKRGKRTSPDWSDRLNRGFSQIIDWFMILEDQRQTSLFRSVFGADAIQYNGVLVIGRDGHLDETQRARLTWRSENVLVGGRSVYCVTFDELYETLALKLRVLSRAAASSDP